MTTLNPSTAAATGAHALASHWFTPAKPLVTFPLLRRGRHAVDGVGEKLLPVREWMPNFTPSSEDARHLPSIENAVTVAELAARLHEERPSLRQVADRITANVETLGGLR